MDRGKDSKKVISFVRELVTCGATALRGNHDQLMIDFIKRPNNYSAFANYIQNGGTETLRSYIEDFDSYQWYDENYKKWADEIQILHGDDYEFLCGLPYYHETEDYIFVHAGINPHLKDWKFTDKDDFIWIRQQFLDYDHPHSKTVVHGHTPCVYLHNKPDIYFGNKKIGIDGACAYGHQLNCLEITEEGFKQYHVSKIKY